MKKIDKHIEIVRSSVKGLSSLSQESCDAIFEVLGTHYTQVGVTVVNNMNDLKELVANYPDLVFLGMKFIPSNPDLGFQDPERVWLADYLDRHGIAYTGSDHLAHQLDLDKALAKQRIQERGLNTSDFYVVDSDDLYTKATLHTYPLFVKPTDRGGGVGIDANSVVYTASELSSKVVSINLQHESKALVEEYLTGREFSVAILKDEANQEFSVMPVELIAPMDDRGVRILSAQVKTSDSERAIKVTDEYIKSQVTTLALAAFYALGARDYGRIDIRMDSHGVPQFLEANLLPSLLNGYGNFPKACKMYLNLDHRTMILSIVNLGFSHSNNEINEFEPVIDSLETTIPSLGVELEPVG